MSMMINLHYVLCLLCPYCTLHIKKKQLLAQLRTVFGLLKPVLTRYES